MARSPVPAPLRTPLPYDWRDHVPNWRITAMLAKVAQESYLDEVRRFEADMLAAGSLSADWARSWRDWLWQRFKRPEVRCAFCDKPEATRPVECNPVDDSSQTFRWFCDSWCQARFETNQPRPTVQEPETLGLFDP